MARHHQHKIPLFERKRQAAKQSSRVCGCGAGGMRPTAAAVWALTVVGLLFVLALNFSHLLDKRSAAADFRGGGGGGSGDARAGAAVLPPPARRNGVQLVQPEGGGAPEYVFRGGKGGGGVDASEVEMQTAEGYPHVQPDWKWNDYIVRMKVARYLDNVDMNAPSVLRADTVPEERDWRALSPNERICVRNPYMQPDHCAPWYIIAGAQKSGTTTMWHWLIEHPQVMRTKHKESHYYDKACWASAEGAAAARAAKAQRKRGKGDDAEEAAAAEAAAAEAAAAAAAAAAAPLEFTKDSVRPYYVTLSVPVMDPTTGFPQMIRGDASPNYLFFPGTPELVSKVARWSRIVLTLRNPVDRAYSGFIHHYKWGDIPESLVERGLSADAVADVFHRWVKEEVAFISEFLAADDGSGAITAPPPLSRAEIHERYTMKHLQSLKSRGELVATKWESGSDTGSVYSRLFAAVRDGVPRMADKPSFYSTLKGMYDLQLEHWLSYIPRSQIHVTTLDALTQQPVETMTAVTEHLALRPVDWRPLVREQWGTHFSDNDKLRPHDKTRAVLAAFYRPHIERLKVLVPASAAVFDAWLRDNDAVGGGK